MFASINKLQTSKNITFPKRDGRVVTFVNVDVDWAKLSRGHVNGSTEDSFFKKSPEVLSGQRNGSTSREDPPRGSWKKRRLYDELSHI